LKALAAEVKSNDRRTKVLKKEGRTQMQISTTLLFSALVALSQLAPAEDAKDVQEKLASKYKVTVVNAEGGVVTWGVTLVLKKSGLIAGGMSSCANEYKDGKFGLASISKTTCNKYGGLSRIPGINRIPGAGGASSAAAEGTRPFVMGEKLYVTQIEVKDSVNFQLVSDPINDVIYKAEVRFPFPKGTPPDSAKADQLAGEVFTISQDNPQGGAAAAGGQVSGVQPPTGQTPAPAPAPAPAAEPQQPALAPIEPPAPPPDAPPAQPPTLSLGMTIDQVVAIFGQPKLVLEPVKNKKVYTYPDFKVTFVDGKVSAIQ
jgi:hypothetical protein